MIDASMLLIALVAGLSAWLAHSNANGRRQVQRQMEIVSRGQCCQGRVLAVQRPFLLETATRLYFEFAPPGADRPVQCCHTEIASSDRATVALPTVGTYVTVRYLPENPQEAVIGKLVGTMG
ncbi:MAG: DUF3592 domain-containing protein [Steroidobacteraceae bacterium]